MILADLKTYLITTRTASLFDLAQRFNTDPEAIRGMLNLWIGKGKVRQADKLPGCGSTCGKCNPLLTEIYQWVE